MAAPSGHSSQRLDLEGSKALKPPMWPGDHKQYFWAPGLCTAHPQTKPSQCGLSELLGKWGWLGLGVGLSHPLFELFSDAGL